MHADGLQDLIGRARAGDAAAWRELHARCQPYLLGMALRLMGPGWPEQSASDLVQNTWLRVSCSLAEVRGGATDPDTAAAFRAWLKLVMKGLFANAVRDSQAVKRRPPPCAARLGANGADDSAAPDPPGAGPTPSFPLRQAEQQTRLGAALA